MNQETPDSDTSGRLKAAVGREATDERAVRDGGGDAYWKHPGPEQRLQVATHATTSEKESVEDGNVLGAGRRRKRRGLTGRSKRNGALKRGC